MSTKLGSAIAVEQPKEYGFSPNGGYYTVRKWKCNRKEPLQALTANLAGWEWKIIEGVGSHMLEARLGALDSGGTGGGTEPEVPTTTWELLPNRVEKDIVESTIITALGIGKTELGAIKAAVEANSTTDFSTFSSNGQQLFLLLQNGVKSALVHQPTLHKSQIVSSYYNTATSLSNVGRIISTSTLLSTETIPTLYTLPNYSSPSDTADKPNLRYGWYKNFPTITQVSFNKFQISQTWEYGLWSLLIHGAPI